MDLKTALALVQHRYPKLYPDFKTLSDKVEHPCKCSLTPDGITLTTTQDNIRMDLHLRESKYLVEAFGKKAQILECKTLSEAIQKLHEFTY